MGIYRNDRLSVVPIVAACALALLLTPTYACTTIVVGKDATVDGSVLASHSNDGEGSTDPRLVLIPASDWPPNSERPVFFSPESFPRYVGSARASVPVEAYQGGPTSEDFEPICSIPQVPHTFKYFEETYGAANERQLGIAESTCSGVFGAAPKGITYPGYGTGKACLSVDALTQIAMERHSKARDAIREIGSLAVEHGFYGAGLFEGSAESLIVTDAQEAWIFHILPDPTGASAIWAAQKVPDDSFAVVPNVFIIREIDLSDADHQTGNFMFSHSVFAVASDLGWWKIGKPLDFTAIYSDGEYAHKYYSGRRTWGVFSLFAPSLDVPADYEEWRISDPYPFAARPDKKVGVADVAKAMRSFYEGTEYSQAGDTSGLNLAGGPWKSPDHVAGNNSTVLSKDGGNWERTIGLYRSSDTYIVQSRSWLPDATGGVLWYGAYAAPYSSYVPFAVGMSTLPQVTLGHHMSLDKSTLFWANRYLGNYVQLKWTSMMEEVQDFQHQTMNQALKLQAKVDTHSTNSESDRIDMIEAMQLYADFSVQIVSLTWDLCDHLMFKYADGQIHLTQSALGTSTRPRTYDNKGITTRDAALIDQPGYHADWLEAVGYFDGPPAPPSCADMGWRCGHEPEHQVPKSIVRGTKRDSSIHPSNLTNAWQSYTRLKIKAKDAGIASCHSIGDVAAALGGVCGSESILHEEGNIRGTILGGKVS